MFYVSKYGDSVMDVKSCDYVSKSINSIDIRLGVHGFVRADSEWKCNGMSIPYSKLYFVFSGRAEIQCAQNTCELKPGYVYLIPYGARHGFHCDGQMEKLYFHFTASKAKGSDIFENAKEIMKLRFDLKKMEHLKHLYFKGDTASCFMLKNELYSLVCDFINKFDIEIYPDPSYSEPVLGAVNYIRKNLSLGISISELADRLFVSESMLSKRFAKETGMSIGKFIGKEIMTEAQRRLLLSDEPIQQISESLGFCDQFYFSKKFKQFCGVSPIKYRKQNRDGI